MTIANSLLEKNPPQILIDVNGVGYELEVPMSTFYGLPAKERRFEDPNATMRMTAGEPPTLRLPRSDIRSSPWAPSTNYSNKPEPKADSKIFSSNSLLHQICWK